ncbi:MAG TPA: exo-alpha-sialidase [Bacteroidales bacterium]|nr:exo-alpha-sialidase [Bacteroidales bacterium]
MKNKYLLALILGASVSVAFLPCGMTRSAGNGDGIGTAMVYKGSTVMTTSTPVGRGEVDERVIAVRVETEGSENPLELSKLEFSVEGTTSLTDIEGLKVYFTAGNPRLTTDHLFGTAAVQEGIITVTGSQLLNEGSNHFWVTADLSPTAIEGDFLKGEILSVTVGGQVYPVTPGTTSDARLIVLEHKLLFSGGDYGSVNFRIPAVKTADDGSIVVAVDARRDRAGDLPGNIDIMVRRSTDMGDTWSDAITIADFDLYGASDPSLVRDRNTGDLLCMFASHQGLFQSTPLNPIRFQVCRSQDNGLTWSDPAEHTSQIYAPGWYAAWLASGSVHQMRCGRLIGAIGVRLNARNTISNYMIFSDDGGHSWNYKPAMASEVGDEAKIVELDNGNLMMNIRNQAPDCRKIVISQDGGDSWGTPYFQEELIDPAVNGDLIRYTSVLDGYDKSRLLFSIAAHPTMRKNLTLFLSYDEGATWPVSKVINPGPSGYSCLTILSDGTIGCFYENGEYEEYQLYFTRVSLDWLSDQMDTF